MKKPKFKIEPNADVRGFQVCEFKDAYNISCSLQQSSAIDFDNPTGLDCPGSSYLWLGVNYVKPQIMASDAKLLGIHTTQETGWIEYPVPEEVQLNARMHLSRPMIRELAAALNRWLRKRELSK